MDAVVRDLADEVKHAHEDRQDERANQRHLSRTLNQLSETYDTAFPNILNFQQRFGAHPLQLQLLQPSDQHQLAIDLQAVPVRRHKV